MNTRKLFLTSLLAAATMSVPAYAWTTGADGLPVITDFLPETASQSDALTISKNTVYKPGSGSTTTFTIGNNDLVLDSLSNEGGSGKTGEFTLTSISGGTGGVWFKSGSWKLESSATISTTGDLYLQGGQFWVSAEKTIANDVFLGTSSFIAPEGDLARSALRIGAMANLTGTTTILSEGTNIAFQGGALNITKLSGSGNITTSQWTGDTGTRVITVENAEDFTGTISLANRIQLNWSSSTATFGGLSGSGSVAGGSNLNIKGAQNTTFSGTVGSSTNGVALALTGTGAQSFTGTSYFSTVSVADTAALSLGGTVSLANTVSVSGSGSVSVNDSVIFILNDNYKSDNTWTLISGASSVGGWSNLTVNNFRQSDGSLFSGRSEISVGTSGAVTITEGTPASLVWNGTSENSTWNTSTTNKNWTNANLSSEDKADIFYTLDNVTFGAEAGIRTVKLADGSALTVGDMTVKGAEYTFQQTTKDSASASASISGNTLRIESGAKLTSKTVNLLFDDIVLAGQLSLDADKFSASALTWGKLTFEGGTLHIEDTQNASEFLSIREVVMNGAGAITSKWSRDSGTKFTIGTLSGTGDLSISGGTMEPITYSIGTLSGYTGKLSMAGTGNNLTVEIRGNFGGVIDVNAGTLKMMSSAVLGGTVNINDGGMVNLTGTETNHTATFKVNAGGTLKVTGHDSFKYNDANGGIVMTGAEGNLAKFVIADKNGENYASMTLSKNITLKGNTLVSSEGGASFNTFGGTVTATGTNNTISSEIKLRSAFMVEVTNLGDMLEISGALTKHSDGNNGFKKTGNGVLKLSGRNNYDCATTIEAGRLVAASSSALGSGKTTVKSGAELGLVAGKAVTVTNGIDLESGAKLVVDMTGQTAGTEEIVLTLISNTALKYSENAFELDCTSLLGSVVVLENLSETLSAWTQSLSYSGNTLKLTMTIPEPSVFGLLAGLGALALAGTRRRRRKA
ncbi:beta strand repeat-containing protein [Candidatus Spyradosoma sp. SGI.093]|uniref:beta strand repeat-containing protein n=1 Tax=Candidatus Spyradosoma sp. SGI.093 TaxID=3420583 RepID=UPI003D07C999